jgi:nucleoside-diphosphate-sugar epimerase
MTKSDGTKILIGGGGGYIGSSLVPALLEHGYHVSVVDFLWFGNHLPDQVEVKRQDLFDLKREQMEGFDVFIFLAGLSNDPMAEFSPSRNFVYNAALPAYLAYTAKQAGVKRYIYASSCSVYGYTENNLYDEDSPVTCGYPYGISKLQGERGVFQIQDDDFSVIALRQGTVGGHSPRMRFDLIVNTMFRTALATGKITINNPAIWRPLCDIRDIVSAYLRSVQADPGLSGIFNIAGGNFTVGEVADLVKMEVERLAGTRVALEMKNVQDYRNYKVSIQKAENNLGFKPIFSIQDTVEDLFRHTNLYGDFEADEFYNIRTFRKIQW